MNQFWDSYPVIRQDLQRVQQIILDSVGTGSGELSALLREYASRGGKLLRPGFVLLSAYSRENRPGLFARRPGSAIHGGLPDKIYRIAAAVEMLHMATLIHDDVLDDATTRRGSDALHRSVGLKHAVLMGDLLFSRCFAMVADFATMDSARRLSSGVAHMCAGEIDQAQRVDPLQVTERMYLRRVSQKTALLFLVSFHVGAVENGVNGQRLEALRRVGYNVGMGFQIIDDLLDLTGTEQTLGKPAASDLRQGVITLPVIAALRKQPQAVGPLLRRDLGDPSHLAAAVTAIGDAGGIGYARFRAATYTNRALEAAGSLPDCEVRDAIIDISSRLLDRRN